MIVFFHLRDGQLCQWYRQTHVDVLIEQLEMIQCLPMIGRHEENIWEFVPQLHGFDRSLVLKTCELFWKWKNEAKDHERFAQARRSLIVRKPCSPVGTWALQ